MAQDQLVYAVTITLLNRALFLNGLSAINIPGLTIQNPNTKTYFFQFKRQVLDFQKRHQLSYPEAALYFNIPTASTIYNWQKQWELYDESGLQSSPGRPKR